MTAVSLQFESTLTDRYQTTVPTAVRNALELSRRDKISYYIREDNLVVIQKAEEEPSADPALLSFLEFLAEDIKNNPATLISDSALIDHLQEMIAGEDIDLDMPLSDDDEDD